MSENKDTFELEPPIEVDAGADADAIGSHYANLYNAETGGGYFKLGYEIKTSYKTEHLPDGRKRIRLFVDRIKI